MTEKLTIEGFAGIEHMELDLRKINILIGPQATGKSIVAKLLYFFRSLPTTHVLKWARVSQELPAPTVEEVSLEEFKRHFPQTTWGNREACVRYDRGEQSAQLSWSRNGTRHAAGLSLSPGFKGSVESVLAAFEKGENEPPERKDLREKSATELLYGHVLVPAGRSFFAYLERGVFRMLSLDAEFDPFLVGFGAFYEHCRKAVATPSEHLAPLLSRILSAEYTREDRRDYLVFPDGRRVDLGHCSSGHQEALPLVAALAWVAKVSLPGIVQSLYIEEPEAHLFPITQRHVVELIATVFNERRRELQLVVTTHSPYILTAFNNLLEAGQVAGELGKEGNKKALAKLHEVVPKSQHLSPKDVAAYYLDGKTARSIMTEEGLIEAEEIDSVSDQIAVQFDKILDIRG